MESPLTRSQLVWVLLRLIGLYLCYRAVVGLISYLKIHLATKAWIEGDRAELGSALATNVFLIGFLLPLGLGLYLLRAGRAVHRLLCAEPGPRARKPPVMDEAERERFARWMVAHPEFRQSHPNDQIARFRDVERADPPDEPT